MFLNQKKNPACFYVYVHDRENLFTNVYASKNSKHFEYKLHDILTFLQAVFSGLCVKIKEV